MSSFSCLCGVTWVDANANHEASGVLFSLADLADLEQQIAHTVVKFQNQADSQRENWLREHFHGDYPADVSAVEAITDIVSNAVNRSNFSSTFLCPECGRLAVAYGPDRDSWSFFFPE